MTISRRQSYIVASHLTKASGGVYCLNIGLELGARVALKDCMNVKKGETILIVTDTEKVHIGETLFKVATDLQTEAIMLIMLPRARHGEEPPQLVAEAMKSANAVVCPTLFSLTHTQARKRACEVGSRVATMPGITEDMFSSGGLTADYEEVTQWTRKVASRLDRAKTAAIVKDNSRLLLDLEGREVIASTGLIRNPGEFGNLPDGEAFVAPVEGKSRGEIIIDGTMAGIGRLKSQLKITVRDGYIIEIVGDQADRLVKALGSAREARNIAELGVGTNRSARLIGNVLEDEKVYGTVHIAFGDNFTFGGKVRAGIHLDGVITKPTLYLDDELIIEEGEFKIQNF